MGLARPPRHRLGLYVTSWVMLGVAYLAVRSAVLHPFARIKNIAAAFVGASPLDIRLTAIATLSDVARLLVFPLTLRVDYSPAERTLVTSVLDPRFLIGLGCAVAWGALIALAWRHNRRVEAYGLGWIGIALSPVANLLFPAGVCWEHGYPISRHGAGSRCSASSPSPAACALPSAFPSGGTTMR